MSLRASTWLAVVLLLCTGCAAKPTERGEIVRAEKVLTLTKAQVDVEKAKVGGAMLPAPYGVEGWKVVYRTIDPHGKPTTASGMVVVPVGAKQPLPVVSYQHGTQFEDSQMPSRPDSLEMRGIGLLFGASGGYFTVLADYLGNGDGPGLHPYVHAASTATACVDMLRASRRLAAREGIQLNDQLFLTGYSQGGHATMALHRELERKHADEFKVTASAPGAGPHDVALTTAGILLEKPSPNTNAFFAYVALAYADVYQWKGGLDVIFQAPYDVIVPTLYDGQKGMDVIKKALPATPQELFRPEAIAQFKDPRSEYAKALRENNVYQWVPKAPVRLYHGKADQDVPFENSALAARRMKSMGANIELVAFDGLNHNTGALPSLLGARFWFDQIRARTK